MFNADVKQYSVTRHIAQCVSTFGLFLMAPLAQANPSTNTPTCNGIDTRAFTTSQLVEKRCLDAAPRKEDVLNPDIKKIANSVGGVGRSYGFDTMAGQYVPPGGTQEQLKQFKVTQFDDGDWPSSDDCVSGSPSCSLADAIEACNVSWFDGDRTGGCTIKFDGLVMVNDTLDPNGTSNGRKANNVMDLALAINRANNAGSHSTRKHRVMAIKAPYVTIDGTSAYGFVPTVGGAEIKIMTHDVLIQNLRILPGQSSPQSPFTTATCGSADSFASEPKGEGYSNSVGCPYSEVGPPSEQQSAIRLVSQFDWGLNPEAGFSVSVSQTAAKDTVCKLHGRTDDSTRPSAEDEYHLTDVMINGTPVGAGGGVWTLIGIVQDDGQVKKLIHAGSAVQWFSAEGDAVSLGTSVSLDAGKDLLACMPQPVRNVVIDSVDIGWAGDTVFNTYANVPFAFDRTVNYPTFTADYDSKAGAVTLTVKGFEITSNTMSDITVSRSFIGQGTLYAGHPKGPHSSNMLVNEGIRRFAGLNNVFHNSKQGRNPLVYGGTTSVWVNNIFADLGSVTSPPGQFFAQPNPAADEGSNGPLRIWQSNMTVGDYSGQTNKKGGALPGTIAALISACIDEVETDKEPNDLDCDSSIVNRIIASDALDSYTKDGAAWNLIEQPLTDLNLNATTWGFSVKSIGVFSGHRDEASFTVNSGVIAGVGPKYNKFYYDDRARALNSVLGDATIEAYVPLSAALSFDSGSDGIVSAALTDLPAYKMDASGSCTPVSVPWYIGAYGYGKYVTSGYTHDELKLGLYSDKDCHTKASVYMTGIPSKGTAVWEWDTDRKSCYYLSGTSDLSSSEFSSVNVNKELVDSQNKREVQHATCPLVFAVKKVVDKAEYSDYACYIGGVYVGNVSGAPAATGMVHGKVIKACQDLVSNATADVAGMLEMNEYFPIQWYNAGSVSQKNPDEKDVYAPDSDGYYESRFSKSLGAWVPRALHESATNGKTFYTWADYGVHLSAEWYTNEKKQLLATRYVPMREVSRSTELMDVGGLAYGGHVCSLTSSLPSDQEEGFFPVWYTPNVSTSPRSRMYIRQ